MCSGSTQLINETHIVWLVPLETLPRYVREAIVVMPTRTRFSARRYVHRVVGYSQVGPSASRGQSHGFTRRIFWLARHDPYNTEGQPLEAVDPRRVRPGWSERG